MSGTKATTRTAAQGYVDAWEREHGARKFPSAVWEQWRAQDEPSLDRGSLRTALRRWRRGETDLAEHAKLQSAIAEVLEFEREDLFGPRGSPRSPEGFPFDAFPALGAFDPASETPFHAATLRPWARVPGRPTHDVDPLDLPLGGRRIWAFMPPGAGRSFAAHWQRHRRRAPTRPWELPPRATSILSLSSPSVEALDAVDDEAPLLLVLDEWRADAGAFFERLRRRRGDYAVLAPFSLKEGAKGEEAYGWEVDDAWRSGYVRWVVRRLQESGSVGTRLHADRFLDWVKGADPTLSRFTTPGELLPLLAFAHENGTETLTKQFGTPLVGAVVERTLGRVGGSSMRDRWLREDGAVAFLRMLEGRWRSPCLRWDRALTAEAWAELIPGEIAPATTEGMEHAREIAAKLGRKRMPRGERDALTAALQKKLSEVPAREAVRAFVEARVLRGVGTDELAPSPRWVAEAVARSTVARAVAAEAPRVWGRWCVDPERRPLVDEHLRTLEPRALGELIERTVEDFDPAALGAVAAVEAVFIALGHCASARRKGFVSKRGDALRALAAQQMALLTPHYHDGLPAPRTRPGPSEGAGEWTEFLGACWAWSFLLPTAPSEIPPGRAWLFPGWDAPDVDDLPKTLDVWGGERHRSDGADAEARGVATMRSMLPAVLERATGTFARVDDWQRVPQLLVEAALPMAIRRGWPVASFVARLAHAGPGVALQLTERITAVPEAERDRLLEAMWAGAFRRGARVEEALRHFEHRDEESGAFSSDYPRSPLISLLVTRWPVEHVEAAVRMEKHWDEGRTVLLLRVTPEAHRSRIARALIEAMSGHEHDVIEALKRFGAAFVEVLEELAVDPTKWQAAQAVWEVAPERAARHAEEGYAGGVIQPWLSTTPTKHFPRLLEIVGRHEERAVPDDLRYWLQRKLYEPGADVERVWALLRRVDRPRT